MTLELADLETLKEMSIRQFDSRVARLPQDAGELLPQELSRLQAELEQIYRVVVLLQQNEPDMDRVAAIWEKMVGIYDAFARRASELARMNPACRVSHDRILDLRNAAEERRQLHLPA